MMQPLSGLAELTDTLPRVATQNGGASQPWAEGRNPCGIGGLGFELKLVLRPVGLLTMGGGCGKSEGRIPKSEGNPKDELRKSEEFSARKVDFRRCPAG